MPPSRYAIEPDDAGTYAVIDGETGEPALVRGRRLVALPERHAHDAAAMLGMIESWRHEPAWDPLSRLALLRTAALP